VTIRVAIADDHSLVRQGLRRYLDMADGIEVVGEASNGQELLTLIEGSTLLECDGAGHMVMLERHDQVNAELDQLLAAAGDLVDGR